MTQSLEPVNTHDVLPDSTSVVIIGGGIVGISAALTLAERNVPVVLLEKGIIAGEQSSRNLGWIRKTNRHAEDIPLAQAADHLWADMPMRIGQDVGYRQSGILFLAKTAAHMQLQTSWLDTVKGLSLDSRMLSPSEVERQAPGGHGYWLGGLYTASDGYAEPATATSSMAKAAIRKGAVIIQQCAVRTLSTAAGKVNGVVTERGEIRCDQVLLAGGAWSRRFLGNHGISLPTLPLICSVLQTQPMQGPTETAVAGPDFSFRQHQGGGFIITQRAALSAQLTLDHFLLGLRYTHQLRNQWRHMQKSLGREFFEDFALKRRWTARDKSPFEIVRRLNPKVNTETNQQALDNISKVWPSFSQAEIEAQWAGMIDVTPDGLPVIDQIAQLPGLSIATGFSGHGFGTGPAAGQLAADIVTGETPLVDPSPYRFNRL